MNFNIVLLVGGYLPLLVMSLLLSQWVDAHAAGGHYWCAQASLCLLASCLLARAACAATARAYLSTRVVSRDDCSLFPFLPNTTYFLARFVIFFSSLALFAQRTTYIPRWDRAAGRPRLVKVGMWR